MLGSRTFRMENPEMFQLSIDRLKMRGVEITDIAEITYNLQNPMLKI